MHTYDTQLVQFNHSILHKFLLAHHVWLGVMLKNNIHGTVTEDTFGGYLASRNVTYLLWQEGENLVRDPDAVNIYTVQHDVEILKGSVDFEIVLSPSCKLANHMIYMRLPDKLTDTGHSPLKFA